MYRNKIKSIRRLNLNGNSTLDSMLNVLVYIHRYEYSNFLQFGRLTNDIYVFTLVQNIFWEYQTLGSVFHN